MAPAPRLDALTGLRFVAALGVALAHLPHLHFHSSVSGVGRRFLTEGGIGVPFFFVLSGFVLAYAYHQRLADPNRAALKEYYVSRVGRVWPVHLLTLVLAWQFVPNPTQPNTLLSGVLNAFLLHAWPPNLAHVQTFNSVSWTLSIEAFFYLCLPLLLWRAAKWNASPLRLTLATLPFWLAALTLTACLSPYAKWWSLYFGSICPLVRMGEFTIGMLLGLAFVRGEPCSVRGRVKLRWTLYELGAVLAVAGLIHQSFEVPILMRANGYYTAGVALVVAVFARQRGYLSAFMASPVPRYLGEVSFSFFMLHFVVFVQLNLWIPPDALGAWPRAALYLAAATLAASVVHHTFEAPLRTWIGRLGKPKKKPPQPQVEALPERIAA
jgi:peptidoglycan/LPS O-acetylase OafA/YrhL